MPALSLPPGPGLPGPAQAVLWGLRYPQFTRAGHERFGPTFTIRPGTMPATVLTTDRDAIRRLFTGDPLVKHHGNDVVRPLVGDGSLFLLEPAPHLQRRKLLLPPFHGQRVRGYASLMQRLTERQIGGWRPGDRVAVLPNALNVTIEVILQAVLGVEDTGLRTRLRQLIDDLFLYPLGPLRRRLGARPVVRVTAPRRVRSAAAFAVGVPSPAVSTYFPEIKTRSRLNVSSAGWWRIRDRLVALLDAQIAATRADPALADRDDILALLVQARDEDGAALSTEELREDLVGLIAAGHETTAAAIAWGAALLAHNPDVRERAAAAAHEDDDAYLGALVKEVLRIRTPVPVAAVRVLSEPFAIGAHTIAPGTPILVDGWGVHHDPELYPEPERFRPERFLDAAPEPYTWLPFGGGAHRCLGAALAELEIRIALGSMLRRVTPLPAEAKVEPPGRRGIVIVPQSGGRIRVG